MKTRCIQIYKCKHDLKQTTTKRIPAATSGNGNRERLGQKPHFTMEKMTFYRVLRVIMRWCSSLEELQFRYRKKRRVMLTTNCEPYDSGAKAW